MVYFENESMNKWMKNFKMQKQQDRGRGGGFKVCIFNNQICNDFKTFGKLGIENFKFRNYKKEQNLNL